MTAAEIKDLLLDAGLTAEQADAAIKNEKVNARAAALAQKKDYDAAMAKAAALEQSLTGPEGYETWYKKNYPAVQQLQTLVTKYTERYGSLDAPTNQPAAGGSGGGQSFDAAAVQRMVAEEANKLIQTQYAPRWTTLLKSSAAITERHMRNKRDTAIDWEKIDELAGKHGGDVQKAYEEYDRPAAEAAAAAKAAADKTELDKTVEKRARELAAQYASKGNFQGDPLSNGSAGLTHRAETKDPAAARSNRLADAIAAGTGKARTDIFSGGSVN
jgi:hypothetical protein